jgi:hypothetical protein
MRPISFEDAKRLFLNRYTLEHVPQWAREPHQDPLYGLVYYAPHYASDREWYDATRFMGEEGGEGLPPHHCYSFGPSWPLGKGFLREPFCANKAQRVAFEVA